MIRRLLSRLIAHLPAPPHVRGHQLPRGTLMTTPIPARVTLTDDELVALAEAHWPTDPPREDSPLLRHRRMKEAVAESVAAREAAVRAQIKTVPTPETMSDAEGEAWEALWDDTGVICCCDHCNYYLPAHDVAKACVMRGHIEAIIAARIAGGDQ